MRKALIVLFAPIFMLITTFDRPLLASFDDYSAARINGEEVEIYINGRKVVLEPSSNFIAIRGLKQSWRKRKELEAKIANYHFFPSEMTYITVSGELPFLLQFLKKNSDYFIRIPIYCMRHVYSGRQQRILVIPTNRVRVQFIEALSQAEIDKVANALKSKHRVRVTGIGYGKFPDDRKRSRFFREVIFQIDPAQSSALFEISDSLRQLGPLTVEPKLTFHFLEF